MRRLAGRIVFTVGTREYRGEDVAVAAHLWGEHARIERRIREEIAWRKDLETRGEELPEAEVDEAADSWRYERDLLAADDLQAWLDERRLGTQEWLDYIYRSALRIHRSAQLGDVAGIDDVSSEEVDEAMYCEAMCSGRLGQLTERLAGQAAAYDRMESETKSLRCSKADIGSIMKGLPRPVRKEGILGVDAAASLERAELVARLTLVFERFIDRIASPAALEREIEAHALEWTRLSCETVAFSDEGTAREAALLVREDRLPITKAAKIAKSALEVTHFVLEDVEPPLKDRLVGARPGELVGPLSVDSGFVLISVVDRVAPSIDEAAVHKRAEDRVVRRTIRREIETRVRWHEHF